MNEKRSGAAAALFVFFLIFCILLGFLVLRRLAVGTPGETRQVIYTLRVSGLDSRFSENLTAGQKILAQNSKMPLGTVLSVLALPSEREVYSAQKQEMILVTVPEKTDLLLTVECSAKFNTGYVLDGKPLTIGRVLSCRTGMLCFCGEVSAFETA